VRVLDNDYILANMFDLTAPSLSPNLPTSYFAISVQRLISSFLTSEVLDSWSGAEKKVPKFSTTLLLLDSLFNFLSFKFAIKIEI
jgi:hypothetical protein